MKLKQDSATIASKDILIESLKSELEQAKTALTKIASQPMSCYLSAHDGMKDKMDIAISALEKLKKEMGKK